MKRAKSKKRIVLIVLYCVLALLVGGWWFLSVNIYSDNFNKRFESYEPYTAMDGFAASDAAVMVVHSEDDGVVPIEYGYDVYYEKYGSDPRFTFIRLKDSGHSFVYDDTTYIDEFNAEFDDWLATLDYDVQAGENRERFISDKAEYIHAHLDRTRWCNMLNEALFDRFLTFLERGMRLS